MYIFTLRDFIKYDDDDQSYHTSLRLYAHRRRSLCIGGGKTSESLLRRDISSRR